MKKPSVKAASTASSRPVTAGDLWSAWRTVSAEFSFRRMMVHLSTSRAGWGLYGVDVISALRDTPMARAALPLLLPLRDDTLNGLARLAALNARRNEALWRMAALFYVTVPTTLLLAGLDGAPDVIRDVLSDSGWMIAGAILLLTIWLMYYFSAQWRARQIEAVVELARIERGLDDRADAP